ncbi:pilus assembly protein CpaE [Sphingomonas sp. MG17]|uniref:Pilus assembly protein CpaE n=1 Tax=Sphingomonas tagetis TaxID=2949092 RepID=A0A9X2HIG7_9SPHN|nr:pilus assembly protein CpaE [Sphingomonas tagetis]MCP3729531.1 pilus assembly protein CpaE [Sphingomonas tagetis]
MEVRNVSEWGPGGWRVRGSAVSVELVLSQGEIAASEIGPSQRDGFVIELTALEPDADVPTDIAARAQTIVVEVRANDPGSLRRLERLRERHPRLIVVAAARDTSLASVRAMLRVGASDVVPLPLLRSELEAVIDRLGERIVEARPAPGKLVAVIKSVGGVGATALVTQLAALYASREAKAQRQTALLDLDLQNGNVATYLGLDANLTVGDLLEAGSRLDLTVLRSIPVTHAGGLAVFAAPVDILPLEAIDTDQMCNLVDLARTSYDTVFLDLPNDWTNWSLSLISRASTILFTVDLTIASLRKAQRQLALLERLGIPPEAVRIVVNRAEKKMFRSIDLSDAERVLKRPVAFTLANDFALVMAALNEGILVGDIKGKSRLSRDLSAMMDGLDELLGRS